MKVQFCIQFIAQQAEACGQDFCVLDLNDDDYDSRYDIVNESGEHLTECPLAPFSKDVDGRPVDTIIHIYGLTIVVSYYHDGTPMTVRLLGGD